MHSDAVKEEEKVKAESKMLSRINSLSDLIQIEEADLNDYFELRQVIREKELSSKKVKFNLDESSEAMIKFSDNRFQINLPKYLNSFNFLTAVVKTKTEKDEKDDCSRKRYCSIEKNIGIAEKQQLGAFLFANLLKCSFEWDDLLVKKFLEAVPLKKIDLLDLLMNACIGNPELYQNIFNLYSLMSLLSGYDRFKSRCKEEDASKLKGLDEAQTESVRDNDSEKKNDDDGQEEEDGALDFNMHFLNTHIHKFLCMYENATNLASALILAWIVRSLLAKVSNAGK